MGAQNRFIEALDGQYWAECLNDHIFMSAADTRKMLEDRRGHYNEHWRYCAIGHDSPIAIHYGEGATGPSS